MLSPNAITVLEKRYLRKDDMGKLAETPEGLFRRVALALAEADRAYGATEAEVEATAEQFFALTYNLDFLPNSPTLANAGTPLGQLSACFVLPVPDDLAGIFETIKRAALIHQTGGGTGFAFSGLRPKNDLVNSTKGVSSGPVSFMRVFNAATESIKQGGMRRGANMGILRVDHPDILEFIDLKADLEEMKNFNVSVALTDAFMAAVEAGTTYPLVNPRTGAITGTLDARDVFQRIVERAWATGEPGGVFIDRMNRFCPVPWLGEYGATNPCGEMPLIPYESCNLGSINLENFVIDRSVPAIDWDRLRLVVHVAMHLLDNVIDANKFPLAELKAMSDATRKIGLGVMGFGRMLFKLGVAYGSEESFLHAEKLMSFIDYESKLASVKLAMARGQFPARNGREAESNALYRRWCMERETEEHRHQDCDYTLLADLIEKHGLRNSTTTTVAPTGTLSLIASTSGGCEPVFALAFKRYQADTHMVDADPVFADALRGAGFPDEAIASVFKGIDDHHGSLRAFLAAADGVEVPGIAPALWAKLAELEAVYVGAHDITPAEHVLIQAAFQKYTDASLSKTINFPASATVEDAMAAYRLAWETGCKGITIYRDGARENQPLSTSGTLHTGRACSECTDTTCPAPTPTVTLSVSTEPPSFMAYQLNASRFTAQGAPSREQRLISTLGLAGEAGEVVELLKKVEGHGHPLDLAKLAEELGDLLWYMADVATAYGLDLSTIAALNIAKLGRRYPEGFNSASSLARRDTQ